MTNYSAMFNTTGKANDLENLFYFRGTSGLSPAAAAYTRMKWTFIQYTYVIPTNEIKTLYEISDLRKSVSLNSNASKINKYNDLSTAGYNDNADDYHVIRYSDVLMMYAETLIELETDTTGITTNLDNALSIINKIRQAHGGSGIRPISYINKSDLSNQYRLERRKEFLFEGNRLYDLLRWGVFVPTIKANLSLQTGKPITTFDYITEKYNLFPLPYKDLVVNPNLSQNPGW